MEVRDVFQNERLDVAWKELEKSDEQGLKYFNQKRRVYSRFAKIINRKTK